MASALETREEGGVRVLGWGCGRWMEHGMDQESSYRVVHGPGRAGPNQHAMPMSIAWQIGRAQETDSRMGRHFRPVG